MKKKKQSALLADDMVEDCTISYHVTCRMIAGSRCWLQYYTVKSRRKFIQYLCMLSWCSMQIENWSTSLQNKLSCYLVLHKLDRFALPDHTCVSCSHWLEESSPVDEGAILQSCRHFLLTELQKRCPQPLSANRQLLETSSSMAEKMHDTNIAWFEPMCLVHISYTICLWQQRAIWTARKGLARPRCN